MSTPASKFTVGQVVIAAPDTAPCPVGVTGLDTATCGAIASGEAADLTDKVFGPGAPAVPVARDKLPQPVQTLLNDCDGSSTCKLVSYDFDASTGQKRDTLSHVISTVSTTAHNAGVFVKDGAGTPPLFRTIPGYNFDGMFSFNPDADPRALGAATTVVDERYCARACDNNDSCGGFNYEQVGRKCTLFPKEKENDVYKDGRVAFIREDISKVAKGSDPPGTNLAGTGVWCGVQNLNECNSDISNVITSNPEILSFTTSDLASCAACPAKTVTRTSTSTWAVTNEIDTTTISMTAADTIAKLQYTTSSAPNTTTILTPGSFYRLRSYLPGMPFTAQTFLYMKKTKKFEVYEQNRYWVMSGTSYSIPAGTYLIPDFIAALNSAGTPGTFSFDGSKVTWTGSFVRIDVAGTLQLAGFVSRQESPTDPTTGLATIVATPITSDDMSGGFFSYGKYLQVHRTDNNGFCVGADGINLRIETKEAIKFGTLGTDFTWVSLGPTQKTVQYQPVPVDYVQNGFLLLNPQTGRYFFPPTSGTRAMSNPNQRPISYESACKSTPEDTTFSGYGAYFEDTSGQFYKYCNPPPKTEATLPSKYSAAYNAFIFVITPSTYEDFYADMSSQVPDQPLIIRKPSIEIPYIFSPTEFRVLQFPSMATYNSYLAANPSWSRFVSGYNAPGDPKVLNVEQATSCEVTAGKETISTLRYDVTPHTVVYDDNFWSTVPVDERVEISDPKYGCADPDNPGAYIGGEYQKTVGTVTFCELCPAGTYSLANNPQATSCTPCAQGTYCPAGAGSEQSCASGYYCPTPAAQIECPAGSYCPVGAASHTPCVAGDYCPAKSTAAQDCPAGEYCPQSPNNGPWGALKTTCPAGNYCPVRSTAPRPCTDPTRPGITFFCPPGTRTLNECPAGKFCTGTSMALPCPPGNYCPTGSGAPITCPGDSTYVPLGLSNITAISQLSQAQVLSQIFTGGSTCYSCPPGTTANASKTGCNCPAPLVWLAWTNECLPNCPAGQAANAAKTGCENCGDNTYTPVEGLAKCITCATNVTGAPAVHNATKTGCVCNGTITGGSYEWNSTWNRCKVKCNDDHVAYWSRCYAKTVTATPISYTVPSPTPDYVCPNGSQNSVGTFAKTTICTTPSKRAPSTAGGCTSAGCFCNFWCPSNWNKNGPGLPWNDTYCSNNRSCYRGTIIASYNCPPCWKASYYETGKSTSVCPSGFSSSPGTTDCDLVPSWIKDETSLGLGTQYSARCIWAGNTNPACGNCPLIPAGGYSGPTVDTSLPSAMKMKCTMYNAPATPDPWGADGASPQLDASGNIMLPSLVTQALQSIAPPAGDPNIPCLRGEYLATAAGAGSTTEVPLVAGQALPGSCAPCPTGTFCDAGYAAPFRCPAGAYCPTPKEFYACTGGQVCPAGSTGPSTCPSGFYCPSSSNPTPIKCPAGKYCPGGTVTPLDCNTGEYCPEGSSEHNMCAAGSYCRTPSETARCPAGKYCPTGTTVPRDCEAGNYCPAGSKVATPCAIGQYCPANAEAQKLCDAGYYCPDPATRTACPAGTYSGSTGQTASSACLTCPAGTTCPYDGAQTLFPTPNTAPLLCAPGYYCPAGSATFNPCPDGWYCPTSSQKTQCPQGYVCPLGTVTYGTPPIRVSVNSSGSESCRATCARGTGLPQQWNGAICVGTNTAGTTCETINNAPVSCNCQQALGFGWIVGNGPTGIPAGSTSTTSTSSATATATASTTATATLIDGRPGVWGTTVNEVPNNVLTSGRGYANRDIRQPLQVPMVVSDVIMSPNRRNALVFQPNRKLAMWTIVNGTWTLKWESPEAPLTTSGSTVKAYMMLDTEGYFYASSTDFKPEWGWKATFQTGPYRATAGPFSLKVADDGTMHMYRANGAEVTMEPPFPTTTWVDTPVDCIPGPITYPESVQNTGCQTSSAVTSPSSFDDFGTVTAGRRECRYADGAMQGTARNTALDRPPKNGGRACLSVGIQNINIPGMGTVYASNTERCYPGACGPL